MSAASPKQPPHSIEAEQSVLGGLMLDNRAWFDISDKLAEGDFYTHQHQVIFRAIKSLLEQLKPCDFVTLSEHLRHEDKLDAAGGIAYLGSLVGDTPGAANIHAYAQIVRERSILRQLIASGTDIAELGFRPNGRDASVLLDAAEKSVFAIRESGERASTGYEEMGPLIARIEEKLERLREDPESFAGLATGFTDLDKLTTGLHPGDLAIVAGRPGMGKCLAHDAELVLDDGSVVTIEEIYRRRDERVATLKDDFTLARTLPSDYVDDGERPVFEVTTRLGRRIETTLPHPFLTLEGWLPLAQLRVGDVVAVPRSMPVFGQVRMRECEVKLLGYLLSDGGLGGVTPHFATTSPGIEHDFVEAVAQFGGCVCSARRSDSRGPSFAVVADPVAVTARRIRFAGELRTAMDRAGHPTAHLAEAVGVAPDSIAHWVEARTMPDPATIRRICEVLEVHPEVLVPSAPENTPHESPNPMSTWLRGLGFDGRQMGVKRIPAAAFRLPREQLALLINRLFASDGWASVSKNGVGEIGYATANEALARQVQHLLLRFGVVARLRLRWVLYRDARRPSWQLEVTSPRSLREFARSIGMFTKEDDVANVIGAIDTRTASSDDLPAPVWKLIERAKGELTWVELGRRAGLPQTYAAAHRSGLSRERLARIAMVLNDGLLTAIAHSDVHWDRIESIVPAGDKQVYDLTIPDTHNFIANDVCVHNTSMALNVAEHVALEKGKPVAVFSMEMSAEQLAMRILSSFGQIDQQKLRSGQLDEHDWGKLASAGGLIREKPLFIDETGSLSPLELRARARRIKKQHGLALIVVDYIQLMQVPETRENRTNEISEISRGLKALAKELSVPVIAISQLSRAVEQRDNKRPRMADLRECVAGDTLVCLQDGRRVPIRDLVGQKPVVWAINATRRLEPAEAERVWCVGRRPVFDMKLASGRRLRMTAEHRVYCGGGWKTLSEISAGERVAIARHIPRPPQPKTWPDHHLVLLGHLVGDGSFLRHQPLRYATASEENSAAVRAAAEAMGSTVTRYAGRGKWHQLLISGNGNRWHAAGVGKWLKELGIFGQRSHEKRLPAEVFELSNEQIALLLRHLWATDGSVWIGGRASRVYFATSSLGLAEDVAALLLRLGIVARLRGHPHPTARTVFSVDIEGWKNKREFALTVGGFGPRAAPVERLLDLLDKQEGNTNVDTLPPEFFRDVRALMAAAGVTRRQMAELRGTALVGGSPFSFCPSRNVAGEYAALLGSALLLQWAFSDLFWDRVTGIEPAGEEEVYDLTVPGPSSWLADGIVSHNSGGLEQDADLVLFVYRDEYYNRESADRGTAELIVAKQRNGPTDTVKVTFLGQYTRFQNFASEYIYQ